MSSFDLDAWKREFSNSTNHQETLKWFTDNFDAEKFNISVCQLDDLPAIDFIRANRINGYLQQLDPKLHRTAFGIILVNSENPSTASGIWVTEKDISPRILAVSNLQKELGKHLNSVFKVIDRERPNLVEPDYTISFDKLIKKVNGLGRALKEITDVCQAVNTEVSQISTDLSQINELPEFTPHLVPQLITESDFYEACQWTEFSPEAGHKLETWFFPTSVTDENASSEATTETNASSEATTEANASSIEKFIFK